MYMLRIFDMRTPNVDTYGLNNRYRWLENSDLRLDFSSLSGQNFESDSQMFEHKGLNISPYDIDFSTPTSNI